MIIVIWNHSVKDKKAKKNTYHYLKQVTTINENINKLIKIKTLKIMFYTIKTVPHKKQ